MEEVLEALKKISGDQLKELLISQCKLEDASIMEMMQKILSSRVQNRVEETKRSSWSTVPSPKPGNRVRIDALNSTRIKARKRANRSLSINEKAKFTISFVLNEPILFSAFQTHLKNRFAEENILFWKEVTTFSRNYASMDAEKRRRCVSFVNVMLNSWLTQNGIVLHFIFSAILFHILHHVKLI